MISEIPVELYVALRWSVSGAIFAAYLFATRGWRAVSRRDLGFVSLLGVLGYGVASILFLYGLKLGGVVNFALVGALGPAITSTLAIVLLRERPQPLYFIGLPLCIVGLLLLTIGKYQVSSLSVAGWSAVLILGAGFLEALVFLFSRRFKERMPLTQYLALAQWACASFMWIAQGVVFHQTAALGGLSARGWGALIFVSVVACVLCYVVLYWLLRHIDGHRLALFDVFHALSATLFGAWFYAEPLSALMGAGGVLILFGLVAGNWPRGVEESPE